MRGLRIHPLAALGMTFLFLAGCGKQDFSKPPNVAYGRDVCAGCRMIIQDERFGAAAFSGDGRPYKFDDIGCLVSYEEKQGGSFSRCWVRDMGGKGWVERSRAVYACQRDLVTPMGSGIAAFGSSEDAEGFVRTKGARIVRWDELPEWVRGRNALNKEDVR